MTVKKSRRFDNPFEPPRSEPALDQGQVVQAALDLLDEVGLDALSMRRLAERLNIKAASLYWHVRDKDHLLALLADAIVAPLQAPDPSLPWRERLEAMAEESRRVMLAHRDAARVLARSGPPTGPHRLRLVDEAFRTLIEAGFSPEETAHAGHLLNDYVTLFVVEEANLAEQGQELGSADARRWLDTLPPGEYAGLRAVGDHLVSVDGNALFRFGMEVLLDGLELRLARRKSD